MRILQYTFAVLLFIGSFACSAPKNLTTNKVNAEKLEAAGNFAEALMAWEANFAKTAVEEVRGEDFSQAAKTAFKAGNAQKAISWFDQARYKNYADAEMYKMLAEIYQSEDNLSKELSALEFYAENFNDENKEVSARLFAIYAEIDANDKALEMWENLDAEAQKSEANRLKYFNLNKALENNAVCDSVSMLLLEQNPENIAALEWNAKKYYWAGQNRYKREMDKYNQKKTRKNYAILLKELEMVTADFKKALPYLNQLWELNPGEEYAGYLANIYALFGDKKKTEYYKNFRK